MPLFASVIHALRAWFTSFPIIQKLLPHHLTLLFGGLGIQFLEKFLYKVLPFSSYSGLNTLFNTIPLSILAYFAYLLGAWLTLISRDIKLLSYGLWLKAFIIVFPFVGFGLGTLVEIAVYIYLGYLVYKFAASPATNQDTSLRM